MAADKEIPDEIPVYNIHDGLKGRNGGPFLDEVQREEAEKRAARIEGRKPNLDEPEASSASDELVTAAVLLKTWADTLPAGTVLTEDLIEAPVRGYIPNPAKQAKEEAKAAAKEEQDRAANNSKEDDNFFPETKAEDKPEDKKEETQKESTPAKK